VLKSIPHHLQPASVLGIQGCGDETFISQAGCYELFARRKGGNAQKLKELVLTKVFQEDAEYESDDDPAEYTPPDEPTGSIEEVTSLERLAHQRAETTLVNAQALAARAAVLQSYTALNGDPQHPDFMEARANLLADMCQSHPIQYVTVLEYIKSQGYPETAALRIAGVFGVDLKRVYLAERGRAPPTCVAIYPGATSHVCIYDKHLDSELLGSCWRNFQRHRAWFRENYAESNQRKVDRRYLAQMKQVGNESAPGWGSIPRTPTIHDRRSTPF